MRRTIERGDWGDDVTALQMALQREGLRVDVDGVFGRKTMQTLKEYQALHHLTADGICGYETWAHLGFADVFDRQFQGQPRREVPARRVILHHTVTRSVEDTFDVLVYRGLSTHYIVGPDGRVYETLDPEQYRARHAGLGHRDDSIGIDIVNPYDIDVRVKPGTWDVLRVTPWAPKEDGCKYRKDTDKAVEATWNLVSDLCKRFGIPRRWVRDYRAMPEGVTRAPGIWAHGQMTNSRWDGFGMLQAWDDLGLEMG